MGHYGMSHIFEVRFTDSGSVECRVKILNINQGYNQKLMDRCRTEVLAVKSLIIPYYK